MGKNKFTKKQVMEAKLQALAIHNAAKREMPAMVSQNTEFDSRPIQAMFDSYLDIVEALDNW